MQIAQIDHQEEGMDDGEYLDDSEDGDCSSISGDDDDDRASDITGAEHIVGYGDDNVSEQSPEILAETIDDQPGNYSDGWLYEETPGEEESLLRWASDEQHREPAKDCLMEKDLHSQGQSGPHVRTSAITGVGLQELLELIDEKLRIQDEKMKAEKVVQRGVFNRKWRPPRAEDAGAAVEQ